MMDPQLQQTVRDIRTFVLCMFVLYVCFWGMNSCFDWGQNGGIKCRIGYNPVTHECVDPPWMRNCSAWSPPLLCWAMKEEKQP